MTTRPSRKKKVVAVAHKQDPAESVEVVKPLRPYLVGIGASAGGLEALSTLIAALPTDLGISYVVLQHLSPTHRSMMVQLLGRETAMAVKEAENGVQPEPDTIYVAPASRNLILKDGCFVLIEGPREVMPRPSVNVFLTSLAAEKIEDAIGVILSGTGSDGAAGLRDVKAGGGYTFAQDPQSAKYAGMPQSAIDTGCVDWVLPPDGIAAEIAIIARSHGTVTVINKTPVVSATALKRLLIKVKQQTRIDFSGYKEGTLWRRIERRMAAKHVTSLEDYQTLVDANPEELEHLGKDILISVTAFFRDPESFDTLRTALRSVVQAKQPGDEIRVWVPGCATGEEAYTIAILIAEALGPNAIQYRIQIFATDIDLNALAVARKGSYAESALADLDPELVQRYFLKVGTRLEVSRNLRDMVVVARQDIIQDPPFLRLDLVSCRNLLIYLQNESQAKVLATFHYGLNNPGGLLFLGKSEGIFQQEALYEVVDKAARLYRRRAGESRLNVPSFRLPDTTERTPPVVAQDAERRLLDAAVRRYVPASVLINSSFDILQMHGDVSQYLTVLPGKPNFNLQHLLRREMRADLQLLQHHAEHKQESAFGRTHGIKTVDGPANVRIVVHPLERGVAAPFFLVCFETLPPPEPDVEGQPRTPSEEGRNVRDLEDELISTRERLQTVIEELETSNEEMQALNEEVVAANEELQSSNEELEASNEELQSTNEELTTVNEELQVRTGELADALNDLENIQNSVGFPIFVCNEHLALLRFNSPAAALFSLSAAFIKQSILQLRLPPGMPEFVDLVRRAIETNQIVEAPVFSNERHYLLHVSPYETVRSSRGAIVVLLDHTERLAAEREVRKNREMLLSIMNNSTSLITLKDLAGRFEFVNQEFEAFFDVQADLVIGKTDAKVLPRKVAADFRAKELEVARLKTPKEFEDHVSVASESDRYLHSIRFPLLTEDGDVYSICTQSTDITDRKHAEDQLRLAARVFDRAGEGIVVTDPRQVILTVNDAFTKVTGYGPEEVIGKTPALLASGRHDETFYLEMWASLQTQGWWQGEIWNRRKNGEVYPEWLTINSVKDPEGKVINYVGIFSDITIVKESQRRVEFLATHDELTSLPNRALFLDRVRQAVARTGRTQATFAVLFIDLDDFKVVNDSMGHAAGDELLMEIARRLRECIRASDTVARFGGDEFALLIEDASVEDAEMTARRIAEAMKRPHPIGRQSVYPSTSIGICLYPNDGLDVETLLKNADSAMYQAKDGGKSTHHFFTDALRHAADERLRLETGLRSAVQNNELFLLYQPQFDIGGGRLVGVEALLRWQHPDEGLIPPLKFIPLAERSGLIDQIGEWVAASACRQMASWIAQGHAIPRVSINVSPEQLRRTNLSALMRRQLNHYRLDASKVTLELTESALVENVERVQQMLKELKTLGVQLSIDDFGTGYSSLAYLRRLPLDELKIDKSFVADIGHNVDDCTIAQTILAMAQTLGFSVVAEGIETDEQLRVLRDIGCDVGQGYLFATPMSPDEIVSRYCGTASEGVC